MFFMHRPFLIMLSLCFLLYNPGFAQQQDILIIPQRFEPTIRFLQRMQNRDTLPTAEEWPHFITGLKSFTDLPDQPNKEDLPEPNTFWPWVYLHKNLRKELQETVEHITYETEGRYNKILQDIFSNNVMNSLGDTMGKYPLNRCFMFTFSVVIPLINPNDLNTDLRPVIERELPFQQQKLFFLLILPFTYFPDYLYVKVDNPENFTKELQERWDHVTSRNMLHHYLCQWCSDFINKHVKFQGE